MQTRIFNRKPERRHGQIDIDGQPGGGTWLAGLPGLGGDIDPQGHAGLGFGIRFMDAETTSHVVFRKPRVDLIAAVRPTSEPGVDVIAADRDFDGAIAVADPRCLAKALEPVKPNYNIVLLDSPPAAANIMVSALLAADGVLVPTGLDYLALYLARGRFCAVVSPGDVAPARYASRPRDRADAGHFRTNIQRLVLHKLLEGFGGNQVLRGIRTDVSVAEAFGHGHPLRRYRMNARAVEDFRVLADDVVWRFKPGLLSEELNRFGLPRSGG